jgi:WW domain
MSSNPYRDSGIGEEFAPPQGPPPPAVPEGWTARFDEHYQRWYYVNLATKKSQWEKPEFPVEVPKSPQPQHSMLTYCPPPQRVLMCH